MANTSPHYGLSLPTSPEKYDINVFNQNNMIIDSELNKQDLKNKAQDESLATKEELTNHNTSSSAHNDIRELITNLAERLNTLADSDDVTLDQLSEIVDYIKNNKDLIDGITTSKINVSDIINTLALVEANTSSGKVVDALVIKEMLSSIGSGDITLESIGAASSEHTHGSMKTITFSTTEPTTVAEGEIVMVYEDGGN